MTGRKSHKTVENLMLPRRQVFPRNEESDSTAARPQQQQQHYIAGPDHKSSFVARFGADAFPAPRLLESDLGVTAVYDLGTGEAYDDEQVEEGGEKEEDQGDGEEEEVRRVLLIHGLNTPALGLLPLARAIQTQSLSSGDGGGSTSSSSLQTAATKTNTETERKTATDRKAKTKTKTKTHIVLFDLWGHGHSSTPLAPHSAHIFHAQIYQVLGSFGWGGRGETFHVVGFSFGACLAAKFAFWNPQMVDSVALLAPAGVLSAETMGDELVRLLESSSSTESDEEEYGEHEREKEKEREEKVLRFLEGGDLVLPADWKECIQQQQRQSHQQQQQQQQQKKEENAEIIAKALRQWELDQHPGYRKSVLSIFREKGNVFGAEAFFKRFATAATAAISAASRDDNDNADDRNESHDLDKSGNHKGKQEKEKEKEGQAKKGFGKVLIVLGGKDDICSKEQLVGLGFREEDESEAEAEAEAEAEEARGRGIRFKVVEEADHAVVRTHPEMIATALLELWEGR